MSAGRYMKRIYYGWWVVGGAFLLLFCAIETRFYDFPAFFDEIENLAIKYLKPCFAHLGQNVFCRG